MTLKTKQKQALDLLKKGYNVFLSGEAGTGKSFVIEKFISYLNEENKKYVVCAPTGLAALNVEGATIHRTFKLSTDLADNQVELKNVEEAHVIIIDEISMCRRDVFQKVARALFEFENPLEEFELKRESRVCRKKQIVVVGDFFQLPPVIGNNDRRIIQQIKEQKLEEIYNHITDLEEKLYAFQCEEWNKFNFKNIILDEVVRQSDEDYIDNLNKIRKGEVQGLEFIKNESCKQEIKNAIYLTSKNKDAESINQNNLDKIRKQEYTYCSEEDGEVAESDRPVSKFLRFKVGARVMSVVNIVEKDKEDDAVVVNGMIGTVTDLTQDAVTVKFDNGYTHKFEKHKWSIKGFREVQAKENGEIVKKMVMSEIGSYRQIPLKLAWAITIHKSQGQTYEEINLNPNCFCEGQLYVALSRAKDLKKLYLTNPIRKNYLKTSDVVKEFYEKLEVDFEEILEDEKESPSIKVNKSEEYIEMKIPKNLEKEVLRILQGNVNIINADESKIKALEDKIKRLEADLEKSNRRRSKISKDKEQQILELRKRGLGMNRIAKVVGVGDGTVTRVLTDYNVK